MAINTFNDKTPDKVRRILTDYNSHFPSSRLRLFYGDAETGKAWAEENDVIGYVGCSTGEKKIPLLIANSRSHGGPGILDHCIVAIKQTGSQGGQWLYKHPTLDLGQWEVIDRDNSSGKYEVTHNGDVHARFATEEKAAKYIAFMKGDKFQKVA